MQSAQKILVDRLTYAACDTVSSFQKLSLLQAACAGIISALVLILQCMAVDTFCSVAADLDIYIRVLQHITKATLSSSAQMAVKKIRTCTWKIRVSFQIGVTNFLQEV
jgi:hypothetical protein